MWTISMRFWHPAPDLSSPFSCSGPKGLPALPSTMARWQLSWHVRCTLFRPAWWGLTSSHDKSRLERFKDKVTRIDYLQAKEKSAADSVATAEQSLFRSTERSPSHVLCHQRPDLVMTCDHDLIYSYV